MSEILKRVRQVVAVIVLVVVVVAVMNIVGDYRSAGDASDAETAVEAEDVVDDSVESSETAQPEDPASESLGTVTVIIDGLNFREEPSASGQLIRGLSEDDVLEYLGGEQGWYHVRADDGVEGYVSASEQFTSLETP